MTTPGHRWRVGLTGGVASGKSTVAALFAALGVPVIDLDEVAREVVAPGTPLLEAVLARFGARLRTAEGGLDRRALRAIVFADPAARADLEALLHPAIRARAEQQLQAAAGPYQVVVEPLLAERQSQGRYQRVLLVDCDEALQRERLASRDGASPEMIEALLAAQATRAQRRAVAHDVLENKGPQAQLAPAVRALHERYLRLAAAGP
jgi:dephospho-CoA kinase